MSDERSEITNKVIQIAAEQVGVSPSEVTLRSHFVNDLNYDSLEAVEFTMEIEDEFALAIPDDVAPTLDTIEKVVDYIMEHKKDRGGEGVAGAA